MDTDIFEYISSHSIKELNNKEMISLSDEIRKYIIDICGKNGGHLASNLGVVELTIALHKSFDFPKDKLLFDVGHQCYTHKILSGRRLDNLRQEGGIDGFQKRKESPFDAFEAGHSSTSISAAMGMAIERDLNKEDYEIICVIGDSSIANGMAFEALNNVSDFRHHFIIVINDNDMSIAKSKGGIHNYLQKIRLSSKYLKFKDKWRNRSLRGGIFNIFYRFGRGVKNFFKGFLFHANIFENIGCYYIGNVDGYDFSGMKKAFEKAKKINSPVVIHVSTIKGKGYKYSETGDLSYWHSVKPFDTKTGKILKKEEYTKKTWSEIYAEFVYESLKNGEDAILVNPATTVGSKMEKVFEDFKERTFDVGISEEHAVTFASGYSLNGKHSYVSIYSSFMQRAYDQINHDVARMKAHVTLLIDRAGLVGSDGETHQGIFDESFLVNMPNMVVAMAKDKKEAKALFELSKEYQGPFAIRYPIGCVDEEEGEVSLQIGKWIVEKQSNSKKCIISFGPHLVDIISWNLDIEIINAIFMAPLDIKMLEMLLNKEQIYIYDPYAIEGGFSLQVQNALIKLGYKGKVTIIALRNEFIQKGTIESQEKNQNVDLEFLKEIINKN